MNILIVIPKGPSQRLLVRLHTEELEGEVRRLISSRKHTQAMVAALTKGRIEREVAHDEVKDVQADLILSEYSASWDLMK